jgi:hypothetical protein
MAGPSICPSLSHLSDLLLTTYRMRDRLVTQKKGSPLVVGVELDILRLHHLVTRHRGFCSRCNFDEVFAKGLLAGNTSSFQFNPHQIRAESPASARLCEHFFGTLISICWVLCERSRDQSVHLGSTIQKARRRSVPGP